MWKPGVTQSSFVLQDPWKQKWEIQILITKVSRNIEYLNRHRSFNGCHRYLTMGAQVSWSASPSKWIVLWISRENIFRHFINEQKKRWVNCQLITLPKDTILSCTASGDPERRKEKKGQRSYYPKKRKLGEINLPCTAVVILGPETRWSWNLSKLGQAVVRSTYLASTSCQMRQLITHCHAIYFFWGAGGLDCTFCRKLRRRVGVQSRSNGRRGGT